LLSSHRGAFGGHLLQLLFKEGLRLVRLSIVKEERAASWL
jgi:hypothetical protein